MGKFSASLRQRSRPRLVVESFEDRRLLSGGYLSSLLQSFWLTAGGLTSSVETHALTLVTKTSESESSEEKPGEPTSAIVESELFQEALRSEEERRQEAERRAYEDGDTLGGSTEGRESEKRNSRRETGSPDQSGPEPVNDGLAAPRNQTETPDVAAQDPTPSAGGPTSEPVVVLILKHYVRDGGAGGTHTEQGNQAPAADSPAAAERVVIHAGGEDRAERETVHDTANPAPGDTTAQGAGPNRPPAASQPTEASSEGRTDADHHSTAGSRGAEGAVLRHEAQGAEARAAERHPQGQAPARPAAEGLTAARAVETSEIRQAAAAPGLVAESGIAATLTHVETPARSGQTAPRPSAHMGQPAAEVVAAPEGAAEQPLAPAGLGVRDMAVFVPHVSGLLDGVVPFDPDAVQVAMQQFLDQVENLGGDAASWLAQRNVAPWVVALAVGLTAYDVARRRRQQTQRGLVLTDEDGTPLTWFPGLAGLWTMREA